MSRDIIPVGMAPQDVRFDLKTNKLYVVNFGSAHEDSVYRLIEVKRY
jgi:DNA-binding beta-propeller fold protein YncE